MATRALVADLHSRGFDLSYAVLFQRAAELECSQCEAASINGVPCHETGCPNRPIVRVCYSCGETDGWLPEDGRGNVYCSCQGCPECAEVDGHALGCVLA